MRHLLSPSLLLTTVITAKNPLRIIIQHNAHVTLDMVVVLRVTPDYSSPSQTHIAYSASSPASKRKTFLNLLTKPLFAPPQRSSTEREVDERESFVILYSFRMRLDR